MDVCRCNMLTVDRQPGHKASECPEPRSAANVDCRKCGESEFLVFMVDDGL